MLLLVDNLTDVIVKVVDVMATFLADVIAIVMWDGVGNNICQKCGHYIYHFDNNICQIINQ